MTASLYACRYCGTVRAFREAQSADEAKCRALVQNSTEDDIEKMMIALNGNGAFVVCGGPLDYVGFVSVLSRAGAMAEGL